jgi:hypothetical protein
VVREKLRQFGGFQVKVKRGISRITLFRFLLAKLVYGGKEGFHLDEWIVLQDLYYKLVELLDKDPSFRNKYSNWFNSDGIIEFFSEDLGSCNSFPIFVNRDSRDFPVLVELLEPILPSERSYFGLRGQRDLRAGFQVFFPNETLNYPKSYLRRVVGVGYRDKGQKKDTAKDGSPDWREIYPHTREKLIRVEEEKQGMSRDNPQFLFPEESEN